MTANNLDRAMPLEAGDDKREGRRGSLLLPFPSKIKMAHPSADRQEKIRILEALLFAAPEPLDQAALAQHFAEGEDISALLEELRELYATRGVNLVRAPTNGRSAPPTDLAFLLEREAAEQRPLSRAALETLAIIAYHQPATRAESKRSGACATAKGTLDVLIETGWIRMRRGRRRAPGRPLTYGTTEQFLDHFGLRRSPDLPGLRAQGGRAADFSTCRGLAHAQSR